VTGSTDHGIVYDSVFNELKFTSALYSGNPKLNSRPRNLQSLLPLLVSLRLSRLIS